MSNSITQEREFCTFNVGGACFGINILKIQEINKYFEITSIPQATGYIEGILNLRGQIVTIIDLGKKLGLSPVDIKKETRNIIVNSQGESIGLMVDAINDVVAAERDDIEAAPANISGVKGKYFQGVLKTEKQLIGILDIDEVLNESV